jgi:foldase protein PrsA
VNNRILLFAVAATALGASLVSGCGNSVPANSVATVGDAAIRKADFDKWLRTASQGQSRGGTSAAPDPPTYTKCVAALSSQPVPKGSKKPTDAQLKKQCKQQYNQLKGEVMQFLIQAQWVQQEAANQKIKVSDAEVKRSFEDQKKQAFPTDKKYQEFLKTSGMTEPDILFRVKLDTLQQKLTQKVTEEEAKVTDSDVSDYYDKNKKRFAQPERRDLQVVLTRTEAKANQAKRALQKGGSWKSVAKKYSIDQASKAQGGKLPAQAKGTLEKALDQAVFSAKKGQIKGPVKTQFGWYVFDVEKITKASQQSLEQAKETIRQTLASQNQQKALDKFVADFQKKWKERTECQKGYVTQVCKGAKATPTPTPATGAPQPTATPNQ